MKLDDNSVKYRRTGLVLNKKYLHYMIPAMMSAIGISLSEFADSMVVSHLLSSNALAVVNLGTPIVFAVTMTYTMTGVGGSLLFAEFLGRKDKDKADRYFTVSTLMALISGILLFTMFFAFRPAFGSLFGCPEELRPDFDIYIKTLTFFVPVGILVMHLTYFLPVIGRPFLSMGLIAAANISNILLDFVFIRVFDMGCRGAAAATLVSYIIVFAVMVFIRLFGKLPLSTCRPRNILQNVKEILKKGFPVGSVQAGYMITTVFCNRYMNLAFGVNGVVTMSLFSQMDSIAGIALMGNIDNNSSFSAMLKGEGDYYGIRNLARRVLLMVITSCSVMSVLFAVFPKYVAAGFNIHDPDSLELIVRLIRIYVVYYPLRAILLVLKGTYNAIDRSSYAMVLGVLDKAVSIPLIGSILYFLFGEYGLITAFPVSIILILCFIAIVNHRIVKKSNGRYSPVLLLDEDYPLKAICSYSVSSLENVADIGLFIGKSLADNGADTRIYDRISLAAEEMGLYIIEQRGADTAVDFLISTNGSDYILTCRSSGEPFYPINEDNGELSLNELLLTGLFKIKHEYVFGLNSTSLTISAKRT